MKNNLFARFMVKYSLDAENFQWYRNDTLDADQYEFVNENSMFFFNVTFQFQFFEITYYNTAINKSLYRYGILEKNIHK